MLHSVRHLVYNNCVHCVHICRRMPHTAHHHMNHRIIISSYHIISYPDPVSLNHLSIMLGSDSDNIVRAQMQVWYAQNHTKDNDTDTVIVTHDS